MLVSQIARNNMKEATRMAADPLIEVLATIYDRSPDFVTAAVWADDLKGLAEHMEGELWRTHLLNR